MGFDLLFLDNSNLKQYIKGCQCGNHVQQVAYSTYHDALTQICFQCRKIRTSMSKGDVNVGVGEQ